MSDNTYAAPESEIRPPARSGGNHIWARILAVLNILYGIFGLYCIFGIPLFIGSVKLFAAAEAAERFQRTGDPNDAARALNEYHSAAQLTAWNWLIFLIILVAVFVVVFATVGVAGIMENLNKGN